MIAGAISGLWSPHTRRSSGRAHLKPSLTNRTRTPTGAAPAARPFSGLRHRQCSHTPDNFVENSDCWRGASPGRGRRGPNGNNAAAWTPRQPPLLRPRAPAPSAGPARYRRPATEHCLLVEPLEQCRRGQQSRAESGTAAVRRAPALVPSAGREARRKGVTKARPFFSMSQRLDAAVAEALLALQYPCVAHGWEKWSLLSAATACDGCSTASTVTDDENAVFDLVSLDRDASTPSSVRPRSVIAPARDASPAMRTILDYCCCRRRCCSRLWSTLPWFEGGGGTPSLLGKFLPCVACCDTIVCRRLVPHRPPRRSVAVVGRRQNRALPPVQRPQRS